MAINSFVPVVLLVFAATMPEGRVFNVRDFGAQGDGKTKDTTAIQRAVEAAAAAPAGTVVFPPGKYLSGTVFLRSNITVRLEKGATLLGSTEPGDFPLQPDLPFVPPDIELEFGRRSLLFARGAENITICGEGTINGQGSAPSFDIERNMARGFTRKQAQLLRPMLLTFVQCKQVVVRDLQLRDSPTWIQDYLDCEDVRIEGLTIRSHAHLNNDGIVIDSCRNVRIANCDIDSGDDSICLKSTYNLCENVAISNCVLRSGSNALKCGTSSNPGFRNVAISNCTIRDTTHSGLALEVVDGGTMENVVVSNISMTNVGNPIFIRLGDRGRHWRADRPRPGVGTIQGIVVSNITATVSGHPSPWANADWVVDKPGKFNPIPSSITGLPGHPVRQVTLSNVRIVCIGGGRRECAEVPLDQLHKVPERPQSYPEFWMFGELPAYALYCRHVEDLRISGMEVRCREQDYRAAAVFDDARNIELDGFHARTVGEEPLMVFNDVNGAMVRGCGVPAGTRVFLRLQGRCERITAIGNDLSGAATPFQFAPATIEKVLFDAANRR